MLDFSLDLTWKLVFSSPQSFFPFFLLKSFSVPPDSALFSTCNKRLFINLNEPIQKAAYGPPLWESLFLKRHCKPMASAQSSMNQTLFLSWNISGIHSLSLSSLKNWKIVNPPTLWLACEIKDYWEDKGYKLIHWIVEIRENFSGGVSMEV